MTKYESNSFSMSEVLILAKREIQELFSIGEATFVNATGDFAGEDYDNDPYNIIHWTEAVICLNLKVFLEGPYNTTSHNMNINLNTGGFVPLAPLIARAFIQKLPVFWNPDGSL